MAWRINALGKSPLTQLGMNWGLCIGSLLVVLPTVWTVSEKTTMEQEAGYEKDESVEPKKVEDH